MKTFAKTLILVVGLGALIAWLYSQRVSPNEFVFYSTTKWVSNKPQKTSKVSVWKLKVPPKFVVQTFAYYSSTYEFGKTRTWKPWVRFPDGASSIGVLSSLNDAGNVVESYKKPMSQFGIDIGNDVGRGEDFAPDYCVTDDDVFRVTLPGGKCKSTPYCIVYMSYKGWPVQVGAAREGLYKHPQRVCQILRETLSAWTLSIDDLRTDQSEGK